MKTLLRLSAILCALAASKAALAETAVPFDQVFNLGNDQGIRIELDPSDDVLVFNGGTYILWGRNLEIHAGRIQVNADTIIQAFPRGGLPDLASDGAPGGAGADGGGGGSGYPGIAAGTVLIRGTSIEGSGRLIILNDGMDGGAGGNGGPGGPGGLGGPGADTQCKCEASSCAVSSCLGSILPETGAAAVDDPVIAQSMSGYLKLMQDAKILQTQSGREGQTEQWLRSFQVCTPTATGSNGDAGAKGGAGGAGGAGGNGGTGGNVAYVPALQSAFDRGQIVASVSGGVGGKAGKPGDGGEGGLGGPGGMKGCEHQSRFEVGAKGDPGDRGKAGAAGKAGKAGKVYIIQD
ncbi:MAG TPA: hypothetical protein VGQ35_03830 [Dongiaceae bacterium]|jgi:hypothetical protein|nr:hypothetical protein [Dongiaceae bacterium]